MATTTQHAPGTFCWPELATTDPSGAKAFYSALFGWESADSPMGDGAFYTMLSLGGRTLGALYTMGPEERSHGIPPHWNSYVSVESADRSAAKAKTLGGTILAEPFDVMEHGRMAIIQDPTGATFCLWEPKQHAGAGVLNEVGALCWTELMTSDASTAQAFYTGLFGWRAEAMPMGPMTYTIYRNGDAQAGGMMQITKEMGPIPSHWMVYISVSDCDGTVAKAVTLGGTITVPPRDIPNVGRFAVLRDPQGAHFSIRKGGGETPGRAGSCGAPGWGAPTANIPPVKPRSTHSGLRNVALLGLFALAAIPALAQEGPVVSAPVPAAPLVMSDSVAAPAVDFEAFFASFLAQRPDSTRVARVTQLTLERDAGRFTLDEGDLWLATPVSGRVCAAVFLGRGSFSLTPPTPGERERVRQIYGTPTVERAFRALVLVVADSTIAELERRLVFQAGRDADVADRGQSLAFGPLRGSKAGVTVLGECLRYVSESKTRGIKASLAKPFLEGRSNGYFFSLIESEGAARLFFEIDPLRYEDVTLWREPKDRHIGLWRVWRRDDVTMFPRAGGGDTAPEGDVRPVLAVKRHRIECRIAGDMDFAAVAEMECEARDPSPQRWATFTLYDRLKVDSVSWAAGPRARFFRGRDSDRMWVWCDPPLAPGETRTLRVHYHGRLIERVGDWMLMGSSTGWYPKPDGQRWMPFDLTFHSPSQYHLASVGERVSSETSGQVTTSRWRSERPIHNASFVLGIFDEEPFGLPGAPEVTALMFRGKPNPIGIWFGGVRVLSGARMDRRVASDAARAVAFFSRKLGPPPVSRIVVAELPDTGGEAFPGLIQITWSPAPSWGRARVAAEDAVFRAHEVAHQWWGYGVDYRTYHDKWLSEGFAEFAGLWYLREELGNLKSCLTLLGAWREQIFEDLSFRPSDAPPAGPISLGYRSASIEVPGDHVLIVYKKGAWVLHMLRNMLLDLETGDDERFASLMRDFYARQEGRPTTTEAFRQVAERYAGEDLGWFFDQWVHGTDLPTYRFASRTDRLSDGRYKVTCRVEQRGVPEGFRMPVPIRIDFADGTVARVRVPIQGAKSEFELPLMHLAPKAVVFNDMESVLCRVEPVKW